jgi:hypothetical protein
LRRSSFLRLRVFGLHHVRHAAWARARALIRHGLRVPCVSAFTLPGRRPRGWLTAHRPPASSRRADLASCKCSTAGPRAARTARFAGTSRRLPVHLTETTSASCLERFRAKAEQPRLPCVLDDCPHPQASDLSLVPDNRSLSPPGSHGQRRSEKARGAGVGYGRRRRFDGRSAEERLSDGVIQRAVV